MWICFKDIPIFFPLTLFYLYTNVVLFQFNYSFQNSNIFPLFNYDTKNKNLSELENTRLCIHFH